MLQINEDCRISSLTLALILKTQEMLFNSKFKDPFPKLFFPEYKISNKNSNIINIKYKLRNLKYKGEFI